MVHLLRARVQAILTIFVLFTCVVGQRWAIHMRQQSDVSITGNGVSVTKSSDPTQTQSSSLTKEVGSTTHTTISSQTKTSTSASQSSSEAVSSSSTAPAQTTIPASLVPNVNGDGSSSTLFGNASIYNATATPEKLPITPRITPAYSIAGVLLMVSGTCFALIGIKNRLMHISLSVTYLVSLAVTVLILYVMNPPVSNAVQGAYFVAIFLTGCIVGGVAILFTELTEGLGCLFGGFCFSMWLLVLKPGGVLHSTAGVSAFVAAFTLASFSTYFSKITRPYGLMVGTSFGGSTALVIGIDCFSLAGLKEFWAYIWNVNDNLFPLGTDTFPHTRGIKVEIAGIVIFFIAGMISQMKIWKMVEKRREKRAAEKVEDERLRAEAEERRGRRVEDRNERDRQRWEAIYGDGNIEKSMMSQDSGVGDMDSQKKSARSMVESVPGSQEDDIELGAVSPRSAPANNVMMMKAGHESRVTVRVASESGPPQIIDENGNRMIFFQDRPSYTRKSVIENKSRDSLAPTAPRTPIAEKRNTSTSPDIVPLPFKVPNNNDQDDRSSIATFADDEEVPSKRYSGNRLSATGSTILRKLSGRSLRTSKRLSLGDGHPSTEELVRSPKFDDDRASSVAATLDDLSDDGEMQSARSSLAFSHAEEREANTDGLTEEALHKTPQGLSIYQEAYDVKRPNNLGSLDKDEHETVREQVAMNTTEHENETVPSGVQSPKTAAASTTSAMDSKPASLTKDQLPAQHSKVVMSYRTNEWAKHLEGAVAPEIEDLESHLDEGTSHDEVAVPVNIEELQQRPTTQSSPPTRASSQISTKAPKMSRASSSGSTPPSSRLGQWSGESLMVHPSASRQSLQPGTRPVTHRSSFAPSIPQQITESPVEQQYNPNHPYSNNAGVMKRESLLRGNSQPNIYSLASTPEMQVPKRVSTRASYTNMQPRVPSALGELDDDNISLAQRRSIIRQSSLGSRGFQQETFDSHQPQRHISVTDPATRQQQLSSWRSSVQQETRGKPPVTNSIERQRSVLWNERKVEEQRRSLAEKARVEKDHAFDQRMRRGSMLDAHREAMRKMQASANKHVTGNNA